MSKKQYETAVQKALRYESELKAGFYLENGKMKPITPERAEYCQEFIHEVQENMYSRGNGAHPLDIQRQNGKAAALNQLRKEHNFKKRKEEEKIAAKVCARKGKKTEIKETKKENKSSNNA